MTSLSLVDPAKIEKDPRKLAFLFPQIPASRFKEKTDEYYRLVCIKAIEDVTKMTGNLLLPALCVNHKRRKADRRVTLFGRTYYVFHPDELTEIEEAKYKAVCREVGYAHNF